MDGIREESQARLARLREALATAGLDGALVLQAADVFYYAGTYQNAALWVPGDGGPVLLVRKSLERARAESAVADVRPFPPSRELVGLFGPSVRRVGTTLDALPVQHQGFWQRALGARELVDVSAAVRTLRSVKSPWEIERMRETGRRLGAIYRLIPDVLEEGMRELDLAAEVEYLLRKAGCEGLVRLRGFNQQIFFGVIAAGASAAEPGAFDGAIVGRGVSVAAPLGASPAVIALNAPVIVDYAVSWDGYLVDMTRLFVCGALAPELERANAVALAIQSAVAEALRPGALCGEVFDVARELAEREGLGDRFMGPPGGQARFVGHGLGIELDEQPVLAQGSAAPLQAGQTVAVEPKFVFPGIGGVGVENVFVVTESGGVRITELPDDVVRV